MYRDLVLSDPELGEGWAENKHKNHKKMAVNCDLQGFGFV